jgi:nucleotide-binding universal stress UspA family protein
MPHEAKPELDAGQRAGNGVPTGQVVVGVQATPESRAALRWAVAHAERIGARVRAVAVWDAAVAVAPDVGGLGGGVGAGVPAAVRAELAEDALVPAARQLLAEAIGALPDRAQRLVDASVVGGDPATALLAAADDAVLLVLGNAGRGALAGAVTRSVASSVLHHARCPVVLVPDRDRGDPPAPGTRPGQVTAGEEREQR